jgi:TolA-binding protein
LPVKQLKGALLLKASALLGQCQVDGAIQACLQAIAVPPETEDDREAHYLIGYCQMLQGREDQAKETFGSLAAAYPHSPQAGRARLLLGRIGRASQ